MQRTFRSILILGLMGIAGLALMGASGSGCENTSDDVQRDQQEKILAEGTAQVGMPAIKNFRERKLAKDILELRDQEGLVTYTYLENLYPVIVHGKTALGGKLTFYSETIGFPLPYATQFTNPQKWVASGTTLPQADPNGLFSPGSAEGTWLLVYDPVKKKAMPDYVEPRVITKTFKLPFD